MKTSQSTTRTTRTAPWPPVSADQPTDSSAAASLGHEARLTAPSIAALMVFTGVRSRKGRS
ncbi:hypothetical protein ACIQHY_12615 [Streptomyces sp. NPDC092359]|uniref:hypothetical protein n=1 Tax=Streptomyces sp. NPDC092359 TaxID=3366014 RepID=UPI00380017FF